MRAEHRDPLPHGLVTVSPNPSRSEFCTTTVEQRWSAFTIRAFSFTVWRGRANTPTSACVVIEPDVLASVDDFDHAS